MHLGKLLFVSAVLVSSGTACKKDDKKTEGGGGEAKGGGGGTAFETQPISFEWSTWSESRKMKFEVQAPVPKGWKLMTEGDNLKMMHTYMPADAGEGASIFSTSSLTFSATCHGECIAKKIPENLKKTAAQRVEFQPGGGAKILQDGELSPGVYAYVVEIEGMKKGEKQYNVGVTHYSPDWDSVVFCDALLMGSDGKRYKDFLDACAAMKLDVIDVAVGADKMKQEEANLAKCPAATTLTYTAKQPVAEEPKFDKVEATHARSQVGSVTLEFANVAVAPNEWFDKKLEPGQGIISISLGLAEGDKTAPDILSGVYKNDGSSPFVSSIYVKMAGGTSYGISNGTKGDVEVIARTRKKICGKIDAEDDRRSLKGEFVLEFAQRD